MVNKMKKCMGLTLIELIACTVIISILASTALPLSKNYVLREKESALRENLREMRKAIDYYRDKKIVEKPGLKESEYYPSSLNELVETKCLRRIPLDPFTKERNWKTRSTTDSLDSIETDGLNVYDVYSASEQLDKNGNPYSSW